MTKELWINLPVKDVNRSREFFTNIGFSFANGPGNSDTSAALLVGDKNTVVMLFEDSVFKGFAKNELTDTEKSTEVLLSFSAESTEEVDELAKKVRDAGGDVFAEPAEIQGWMYGFAFADPDGHRWNALFMDNSKMKG